MNPPANLPSHSPREELSLERYIERAHYLKTLRGDPYSLSWGIIETGPPPQGFVIVGNQPPGALDDFYREELIGKPVRPINRVDSLAQVSMPAPGDGSLRRLVYRLRESYPATLNGVSVVLPRGALLEPSEEAAYGFPDGFLERVSYSGSALGEGHVTLQQQGREIVLPAGSLITPPVQDLLRQRMPVLVPSSPLSAPAAAPQPQQTLDGVAASLIEREHQWVPQSDRPVAQAENVPTLIERLWVSPWELCYELGTDEHHLRELCDAHGIDHHYRKVADIRTVEPNKGERIVVRVRDDGRWWVKYEYFLVMSIPLPPRHTPGMVRQPAMATETSEPAMSASEVPKIPHRLQPYLLRAYFEQMLSHVIDTFLKQPAWLYEYPSRSVITSQKRIKLWPENQQPDRRQLYELLNYHTIDYKAFVEARRAVISPVVI